MRTSRLLRSLTGLVAGATLLTACGGTAADTGADTAATDSTDTAEVEPTDEATDEHETATDGTSDPTEITVAHAQGETTVPVDPETVVVFDLGVLDTLDALGVDVAGVPEVAVMPERLADYAGDEYEKVGSLFEPDYEAVNALSPDLIIVGGRSAAVHGELDDLAPTIDLSVDATDFLPSFVAQLETIGEVFGVQDEVADEVAALQARVDEVGALGPEAGTGLIVLTTGGELSAYGPGSRFGLIHDELGVAPAVDGLDPAASHGDAISFEFILEADPDHLFVLDRDATIGESGEAAEAILDNEIVAQTTAWQEGNVTYLDGENWYLMPTGLRSVQAMVDQIEAALA